MHNRGLRVKCIQTFTAAITISGDWQTRSQSSLLSWTGCLLELDFLIHYTIMTSWHAHAFRALAHYWPCVCMCVCVCGGGGGGGGGIHWWPVDSPHKRTVIRKMLIFLLLLPWTGFWTNRRISKDLRHHDAHVTSLLYKCHIIAMKQQLLFLGSPAKCVLSMPNLN